METCGSAIEALRRIEASDYDIVVSDLVMGGMHGLELLGCVRVARPNAMVVLITGAADRDLSVRALRGGAYDFIQKPVDPDYLVACIGRAIETRRLRAEVELTQAALRRHAEELEQTVAQRTDELRRASRSKDEFLATISHELRTPLTSILGWARLLHGGRLEAEEQALAIESIARNAKSQAQLIDDLLDVSRIITGKMRLDVGQVDLLRVLDGAIGVVLPAAQAKGITLDPRVDEAVGAIPGDPHRLQQVLWNLLSNAVKFTPSGGHVAVRVEGGETGVEIVVQDDGSGIDPELLPFVFDRFRQGDSQLSSRRGLGLGLAITRHLVELHGGTVTAESPGPGAGATFVVRLPSRRREPSDAREQRRELPSLGRMEAAPAGDCLRGSPRARRRRRGGHAPGPADHAGARRSDGGFRVLGRRGPGGLPADAPRRAALRHRPRRRRRICAPPRLARLAQGAGRGGARRGAHGLREAGGSRASPGSGLRPPRRQARPRRFTADPRRHPRRWRARMSAIQRALVVDDDEDVLRLCRVTLQRFAGWTVAVANGGDAAIGAARRDAPDVILLDVMMPDGGGLSILGRLKGCDATAGIPVVLMTAADGSMIEACREGGAAGIIAKPFDPGALPGEIARILGEDCRSGLAVDAGGPSRQIEVHPRSPVDEILGDSPAVSRMRDLVARAAASDASVLITGESGTGKELVARALHRAGQRAAGPFVAMNCAAVPESLLESELFGYMRGAFTDAKTARRGLFLEADGGTLFLDELGEMPARIQPKLLRALQERTVRPLGGTAEIPFDVRLVAATNDDLATAVAERRFRSDLFFRVNVIPIEVPPLRARGDDVALLARRLVAAYAARHRKRIDGLSAEALDMLRAHPWPGNVRELQNCIERAVALTDQAEIGPDDLSGSLRVAAPARGSSACPELPEGALLPLAEVERRHVLGVLAAVDGNKRRAARILGLDRRTLYRRLDQYEGRG